jgi:ABC-type cobalamin/Fe3+-siderophores transport system ATPase subunit
VAAGAGGCRTGYDTSLGESSVRLSGGQRRRVAIARAAVSKAPMVLLDEPTVSLDPRSAAAVIEAIRTATTHRTVLVVTHDRDLAAIADRVVTLSPASRGGPGVHRSTDTPTNGREVNTMNRIIEPVMNWDRWWDHEVHDRHRWWENERWKEHRWDRDRSRDWK